jgi:hypothetical protein
MQTKTSMKSLMQTFFFSSSSLAPGKRPLSSITPVMVEHDKSLELVLGGSGGSLITTSVMQVRVDDGGGKAEISLFYKPGPIEYFGLRQGSLYCY